MQGIVTVAKDFLTLRRQLLDTPTAGEGPDAAATASNALITYGEMKALARVLGVDLDQMNAPVARNTQPPTDHITVDTVPDYDLLLLTIPANDAPGYETAEWSAFLHTSQLVPLIKALLTAFKAFKALKLERGSQMSQMPPRRSVANRPLAGHATDPDFDPDTDPDTDPDDGPDDGPEAA